MAIALGKCITCKHIFPSTIHAGAQEYIHTDIRSDSLAALFVMVGDPAYYAFDNSVSSAMEGVEQSIFDAEVELALDTMTPLIPKKYDNLQLFRKNIIKDCIQIRSNLETEQRECLGYATFGENGVAIFIQ